MSLALAGISGLRHHPAYASVRDRLPFGMIGAGPPLWNAVNFHRFARIMAVGSTCGVQTGRPVMRIRRMAMSAAFATGLAALPLATAQAQYYAPYYPPCSANPLAWPFCIAGAIVGTAATIATAPFWLLAGAPPYYAPPYYPAPSYYAPGYYAPSYPSYAPPPAAAPQAAPGAPAPLPPPATARRQAGSAPPPAGNAYYFCPTSKAYYPYVATCPVAWRPVPTTPPKS